MAQNFRNYLTRNTGTTAVDALGGAANSYAPIILYPPKYVYSASVVIFTALPLV
jgi:hypothetical protein